MGDSNEVHRSPLGLGRGLESMGKLSDWGLRKRCQIQAEFPVGAILVTRSFIRFGDLWIRSPVQIGHFCFQLSSFLCWIFWEFLSTHTSLHWQIRIKGQYMVSQYCFPNCQNCPFLNYCTKCGKIESEVILHYRVDILLPSFKCLYFVP